MNGLSWADETENEERENEIKKKLIEDTKPATPAVEEKPVAVEERKSEERNTTEDEQQQQQQQHEQQQPQQGGYRDNNRNYNDRYNNNSGYQNRGQMNNNSRYNNNNNNRYGNQQQQQQQGGYQNRYNNNNQQQGGYNNNNNNNNRNNYGQNKPNSVNYKKNETLITGYDENNTTKEDIENFLQSKGIEYNEVTFSSTETIVALKDSDNYYKTKQLSGTEFNSAPITVTNYQRNKPQFFQQQQQGQQQQGQPLGQPQQPFSNSGPKVDPFGGARPVDTTPKDVKPVAGGDQPAVSKPYRPGSMGGNNNTNNNNTNAFKKDDNNNKFGGYKKPFTNNKGPFGKKEEDGWKVSKGGKVQTQVQTSKPAIATTTNKFGLLDDSSDQDD